MMKSLKRILLATAVVSFGFAANAQQLPQPSPKAKAMQTIGLTDVEVEYSRPGVKGRIVWNDLVPYGEVWRTGANLNTLISFSTDVKIGGQDVKAGTYSLFAVPNQIQWTIHINSVTDAWGTASYKEENNVASFKVNSRKHPFTERMTFYFSEVGMDKGTLTLAWENVAVDMPIKVNTSEIAMQNIKTAIEEKPEDWRVYRNAASYCKDSGTNLEQGLAWMEKSLELKDDSWYSHFVYAQLLYMNGEEKKAVKAAKKAKKMGEEEAAADGREFMYGKMIDDAMLDW